MSSNQSNGRGAGQDLGNGFLGRASHHDFKNDLSKFNREDYKDWLFRLE